MGQPILSNLFPFRYLTEVTVVHRTRPSILFKCIENELIRNNIRFMCILCLSQFTVNDQQRPKHADACTTDRNCAIVCYRYVDTVTVRTLHTQATQRKEFNMMVAAFFVYFINTHNIPSIVFFCFFFIAGAVGSVVASLLEQNVRDRLVSVRYRLNVYFVLCIFTCCLFLLCRFDVGWRHSYLNSRYYWQWIQCLCHCWSSRLYSILYCICEIQIFVGQNKSSIMSKAIFAIFALCAVQVNEWITKKLCASINRTEPQW